MPIVYVHIRSLTFSTGPFYILVIIPTTDLDFFNFAWVHDISYFYPHLISRVPAIIHYIADM
jgi:hypothetical protein